MRLFIEKRYYGPWTNDYIEVKKIPKKLEHNESLVANVYKKGNKVFFQKVKRIHVGIFGRRKVDSLEDYDSDLLFGKIYFIGSISDAKAYEITMV